jgi:peptidyl-prolyl cis-trans isomerase C
MAAELSNVRPEDRRRVVIEYLIQLELFAQAAAQAQLGTGSEFEAAMAYARKRVLRDRYVERNVTALIGDAEARALYKREAGSLSPTSEIRVRHILVEKESTAWELRAALLGGGDFATMAQQHSKDTGSSWRGGDIGFFAKGQMVDAFEEAAFRLSKGELSEPVKTPLGWHLIMLEDVRRQSLPSYEELRNSLLGQMPQRRAIEAASSSATTRKLPTVGTRHSARRASQGARDTRRATRRDCCARRGIPCS